MNFYIILCWVCHQHYFRLILEQNAGDYLYTSSKFHLILEQNAGEILLKIQSSIHTENNQMNIAKNIEEVRRSA